MNAQWLRWINEATVKYELMLMEIENAEKRPVHGTPDGQPGGTGEEMGNDPVPNPELQPNPEP